MDENKKNMKNQKNSIEKSIYILTGIVLVFAAFAICVGLGLIQLTQDGIHFIF